VRALGLDLGLRRIGVAVSDSSGVLATPHSVITRCGDPALDRARVADLVAEVQAEAVVVGLPLSLSGSAGSAAVAAEEEARALGSELAVPVELHDERLTTVTAERSLRAPGRRGRSPRSPARLGSSGSRSRRVIIDDVAAAVMLQSWLDGRR